MVVFLIVLAILILAAIFLLMFPVIKVVGDSMYPTLKEGQYLLGCRLFNKKKCKINGIYVVHLRDDEGEPYFIIKRLYMTYDKDHKVEYDFRGDNAEVSADSRQYGNFKPSQGEAKIIGNFPNLAERRKSNEESN